MSCIEGPNTASTGSINCSEGPNTASTGSMSCTEPRIQAVPAVLNPEILGVQAVYIRTTERRNIEILRLLAVSAVHKPEILQVHEVPAVFFLENY